MNSTKNAPELTELMAHFNAGQLIFRQGDQGDFMYVVQDGQVEILAETEGRQRRLGLLEKGDFFGEMAVLEDMPRTASARAVTSCSLIRIDRNTFDQLIRQDPEIAVRMLRKLSHRLRRLRLQMDEAPAQPILETPGAGSAKAFYLLHQPTGRRFPVTENQENTVGRRDPVTGLVPVVDLGTLDAKKTMSRRHAVLFFPRQQLAFAGGVGCSQRHLCQRRPSEPRASRCCPARRQPPVWLGGAGVP